MLLRMLLAQRGNRENRAPGSLSLLCWLCLPGALSLVNKQRWQLPLLSLLAVPFIPGAWEAGRLLARQSNFSSGEGFTHFQQLQHVHRLDNLVGTANVEWVVRVPVLIDCCISATGEECRDSFVTS